MTERKTKQKLIEKNVTTARHAQYTAEIVHIISSWKLSYTIGIKIREKKWHLELWN